MRRHDRPAPHRGARRWLVAAVTLSVALSPVALSPAAAPAAASAGGLGPALVPSYAPGGAVTWGVRPAGADGKPDARTHFTLQAAPGGTVTDRALVTNLSTTPVTFAIYGTDAFNTANGQFDLLSADRKPTDVGAWIAFAASTLTVPAGASAAVPFNVVLPANATPGDHVGGVVVSLLSPGTGPDKKVNLDTRVGVRVYLRVPGNLQPRLAVGPVTEAYHGVGNPLGTGSTEVTYTVTNPGNVRLQGHPTITVNGPFGSTLATSTPKDLPELLPNQTATFTTTVDGVFPAGPMTAKVVLAAVTDPEQPVGQTIPSVSGAGYFWAMPWMLLAVVVLLLAAAGTLWWLRRRRRISRLEAAVAALPAERKPAVAGVPGGRS